MKTIKYTLAGLLVGLSALWLAADPTALATLGVFPLRNGLIQYSGVLAMGAMSIGMLLATRPAFTETLLGGLDKGYRLHKWLGITALSAGVIHWLWVKAPKWMVGWGWLTRPARPPRPEQTEPLLQFLQQQRGLAETIGEWAFYVAVALIALALIKRFPYRRFLNTHRLLAAVYLALVLHSVVLIQFSYWTQPVGWLMAVLMVGGSYAALQSLLGRIGRQRKARGEIEQLIPHPGNGVLEVQLKLAEPWPGHRAGQFAFLTLDRAEGAHPFTIASAWQDDGRIAFMIKGLGDYTRQLGQALRVGQQVVVEGPYGRFDFLGHKPRQVWVAGGIGIAPFVARLRDLAREGGTTGRPVDLFYCTAAPDEGFIAQIRALAERAGVALHLLVSPRDGLLDGERIRRAVPGWRDAELWFCGPSGFGRALQRDFASHGLGDRDFHQELFEMR